MNESLEWCREMLPRVSRSFALGILSLPQPFEQWVTNAYLLCRIADTVEDAPDIPWPVRRQMFLDFEDALLGGSPAALQSKTHLMPPGDDRTLCEGTYKVLEVTRSFPPEVQHILHTWVGEMTYGIATYARRHQPGGRTVLHDAEDLQRYCWYVAGTVGHLLTELFISGFPSLGDKEHTLRERASKFGLLLQLTNIVKDVTDDWERDWCFIPATIQRAAGVPDGGLLEPANQRQAQAAVDAVNDLARTCFPEAVAYCTALPAEAEAVRRFCLFPMLMAGRTLLLAQGNPATLTAGSPVKVSREAVAEVLERTEQLLADDERIAALQLDQVF